MSKMLTLLRRHAIAFAALFLLLSGSAYAVTDQIASGARPKQLYACVTDDFHTLNLTNAGRSCPDGQRKISWNAAGPRGVAGPTGATGRSGARGATGRAGAGGTSGAPGAAGEVGATGAAGAAGPKGDIGGAGSAGPQGAPGPKGDTGATGPTGPIGPIGPTGPRGTDGADAVSNFAEFYALMPSDNASTVAPGSDVDFPQNGPASGTIVRSSPDAFVLPAIGTYRVVFNVPISDPGQLELTLNGTPLAYTVTGRATGTSAIAGEALVQTFAINSILTVRNPASEIVSLTVTPGAGGTEPVSATLTIDQLGS